MTGTLDIRQLPVPVDGSSDVSERNEVEDRPPLANIRRNGIAVLAVVCVALFVWVSFVPLESAVVASGRLIVETHRKPIQSQAGGTISRLLVKEGQRVKKGQVLVEFDRTQAAAQFEVSDSDYVRSLIRRQRLLTEFNDAENIEWPEGIENRKNDASLRKIMQTEQVLMDARKREHEGKIEFSASRIAQLQERLVLTGPKIQSLQEQSKLLEEETRDVQVLVDKGLARKPRLLALQRSIAAMYGRMDELVSERAQLRTNIIAAQQELENFKLSKRTEIIDELTEAESKSASAFELRNGALKTLENTEVLAPENGTIVNLQFFGSKAVVGPGAPIMDIVPDRDGMIVLSRISPSDIDAVYEGQMSKVRIVAYNQRDVHPIKARLGTISADALVDPSSGASYYEGRVILDEEDLARQPDVKLYPGMPVDVVILTGERTFLQYIVAPISRHVFLSFRED